MAVRKKTPTRRKKSGSRRKKSPLFKWLLILGLLVLVSVAASYLWLRYAEKQQDLKPTQVETLLPSLPDTKTNQETKQQENPVDQPQAERKKDNKISPQPTWLEGTWVSSSNGAMLTFKGTAFSMDFPSVENRSPLEGTFVLNGKKIEFKSTQKDDICGQQPGKYTVSPDGNDIVIKCLSDECKRRASNLEASWFKL